MEFDTPPVGGGNYPFGTGATYTCDDGLVVVGSPVATCGGFSLVGSFQPGPPQCLGEYNNNNRSRIELNYTFIQRATIETVHAYR